MRVAEQGPGRMTDAKKKNPLQNTTCASRFTAQVIKKNECRKCFDCQQSLFKLSESEAKKSKVARRDWSKQTSRGKPGREVFHLGLAV